MKGGQGVLSGGFSSRFGNTLSQQRSGATNHEKITWKLPASRQIACFQIIRKITVSAY
jgi:hypothetical protein